MKDYIELLRAAQRVFATTDGSLVLRYLISKFGYVRTSVFDPDNPHRTSYNEGQRAVIQQLAALLETNPADLEKVDDGRHGHEQQPDLFGNFPGFSVDDH